MHTNIHTYKFACLHTHTQVHINIHTYHNHLTLSLFHLVFSIFFSALSIIACELCICVVAYACSLFCVYVLLMRAWICQLCKIVDGGVKTEKEFSQNLNLASKKLQVYTLIYSRARIYACKVCMNVCTYVCLHSMYVCVYKCMYVCICARMYE